MRKSTVQTLAYALNSAICCIGQWNIILYHIQLVGFRKFDINECKTNLSLNTYYYYYDCNFIYIGATTQLRIFHTIHLQPTIQSQKQYIMNHVVGGHADQKQELCKWLCAIKSSSGCECLAQPYVIWIKMCAFPITLHVSCGIHIYMPNFIFEAFIYKYCIIF